MDLQGSGLMFLVQSQSSLQAVQELQAGCNGACRRFPQSHSEGGAEGRQGCAARVSNKWACS